MKNPRLAFFLIFIFTSPVFSDPANLYYCPQTIICTINQQLLLTCSSDRDRPEGWDFQKLSSGGHMQSDIGKTFSYTFYSVSAPFHSSDFIPVTCSYKYRSLGQVALQLDSIREKNLEVYYLEPTKWVFGSGEKQGSCVGDPKDCTLKEQAALNFFDLNLSSVDISVNNHLITRIGTAQYGKVILDSALAYCGDVKDCRIDFSSIQGLLYGYVIVDLNNQMKIVSITSAKPDFADIRQVGNSNSVEVRFTNLGLE